MALQLNSGAMFLLFIADLVFIFTAKILFHVDFFTPRHV